MTSVTEVERAVRGKVDHGGLLDVGQQGRTGGLAVDQQCTAQVPRHRLQLLAADRALAHRRRAPRPARRQARAAPGLFRRPPRGRTARAGCSLSQKQETRQSGQLSQASEIREVRYATRDQIDEHADRLGRRSYPRRGDYRKGADLQLPTCRWWASGACDGAHRAIRCRTARSGWSPSPERRRATPGSAATMAPPQT